MVRKEIRNERALPYRNERIIPCRKDGTVWNRIRKERTELETELYEDCEKLLFSAEEIASGTRSVAALLDEAYRGTTPVAVCYGGYFLYLMNS